MLTVGGTVLHFNKWGTHKWRQRTACSFVLINCGFLLDIRVASICHWGKGEVVLFLLVTVLLSTEIAWSCLMSVNTLQGCDTNYLCNLQRCSRLFMTILRPQSGDPVTALATSVLLDQLRHTRVGFDWTALCASDGKSVCPSVCLSHSCTVLKRLAPPDTSPSYQTPMLSFRRQR